MLCDSKVGTIYKLKLLCGIEHTVALQEKEQLVEVCFSQLRKRTFIAILCFLLYNVSIMLHGASFGGTYTVLSVGIIVTALFQLLLMPTGVVTSNTGDSFMLF